MSQIRCARLRASRRVRLSPSQMAALLAKMGCQVKQGGVVENIYGTRVQADLIIESWQGHIIRGNRLGLKQNADGSWTFLDGLSGTAALGARAVQRSIDHALTRVGTATQQVAKPQLRLEQVGEQQVASLQLSTAGVAATNLEKLSMTISKGQKARPELTMRAIQEVGAIAGLEPVTLAGTDERVVDGTIPGIALRLPSGQLAGVKLEGGKLEVVAPAQAHEELKLVADKIQEEHTFELALSQLKGQVEKVIELKAFPIVKGLDAQMVVKTLAHPAAEEALGLKAVALDNPQDVVFPGAIPGIAFKTKSGALVGLRQTAEGRVEFIAPKSAEDELALARAALNTKGQLRAAAQDPRTRGLQVDWSSLSVQKTEKGPVITVDYTDERVGQCNPSVLALKKVLIV